MTRDLTYDAPKVWQSEHATHRCSGRNCLGKREVNVNIESENTR